MMKIFKVQVHTNRIRANLIIKLCVKNHLKTVTMCHNSNKNTNKNTNV